MNYILKDGEPVKTDNIYVWAKWFESADRVIAKIQIGDSEISTVFLGTDHNFGGGDPILFETLVFGGSLDGEMERYSTLEEAMLGHEAMVGKVRAAL